MLLLVIKKAKFLNICSKFPDSHRVMVENARKRRKQFKIVSIRDLNLQHKLKSLVKLMKVLIKSFDAGFRKIAHVDKQYFERQNLVTDTYKLLVHHYGLLNVRRYVLKAQKVKEKREAKSNQEGFPHTLQSSTPYPLRHLAV